MPLPKIDCACANARRAARLITQLYSQEMGNHIEPGQFSLLMAIGQYPGCQQNTLGQALGFDKSTLSRALKVMRRNDWIEPGHSGYRLTKAGVKVLAETTPGWQRAQQKLQAASRNWDRMLTTLHQAAEAAIDAK